jgi:5-methylcytosine-specific restriction endonuclease McrA
MRQSQNNKCCYCHVDMLDKFGHDQSITLERIDDNEKHILTNLKLACFKCNSAHVNKTIN